MDDYVNATLVAVWVTDFGELVVIQELNMTIFKKRGELDRSKPVRNLMETFLL